MNSDASSPAKAPSCLRSGCVVLLVLAALAASVILFWAWRTNQRALVSERYLPAAGAPGQIITVGDHDLHVRTFGNQDNPPLLLLHGFGVEGGFGWDPFAQLLAEDYFVIVPDLLGFGHSQRVGRPDPAYSHAGQAASIAQLLTALDVAEADVIGASYGGGIAAQLALDEPQRVKRLILLAPQVYDLGGGIFETLGTLPFGLGHALTWLTQGAGPQAEMLATLGCNGNGYCPTAAALAQRQRLAEIEGTSAALVAFSNTAPDVRLPDDLPAITNETLILWGTADGTLAYDTYAERLRDDLPQATLQTLAGFGHNPYKEDPEQTAVWVKAFLNE